jgi:hypothetical protein
MTVALRREMPEADGGGDGNTALPSHDLPNFEVEEIEGFKVERWARFGGQGGMVHACELARVEAAMAARFLHFEDERGREKEWGSTGVPWQLEDRAACPVGPRPAYGHHRASTHQCGPVAGRPPLTLKTLKGGRC